MQSKKKRTHGFEFSSVSKLITITLHCPLLIIMLMTYGTYQDKPIEELYAFIKSIDLFDILNLIQKSAKNDDFLTTFHTFGKISTFNLFFERTKLINFYFKFGFSFGILSALPVSKLINDENDR